MKCLKTLLYISLLGSAIAQAEVLRIPVSQQGNSNLNLPSYGEPQSRVQQQFGEPNLRHPSVGQPPITRWDYPGFSVYFEHSTVINSVQIHQPRTEHKP